jgi:hypothetical protein
VPGGELLEQLTHTNLGSVNLTVVSNFAVPSCSGDSNRIALLRDIDCDKNSCILFHGSSSLREALLTLRATLDPHSWASHRCRQERTYGLTLKLIPACKPATVSRRRSR